MKISCNPIEIEKTLESKQSSIVIIRAQPLDPSNLRNLRSCLIYVRYNKLSLTAKSLNSKSSNRTYKSLYFNRSLIRLTFFYLSFHGFIRVSKDDIIFLTRVQLF